MYKNVIGKHEQRQHVSKSPSFEVFCLFVLPITYRCSTFLVSSGMFPVVCGVVCSSLACCGLHSADLHYIAFGAFLLSLSLSLSLSPSLSLCLLTYFLTCLGTYHREC